VCPEWKAQQKILWEEVRKETGRWKDRWKIRDLQADERCSRAVLDFLSSTDAGRRVPVWEDAVSGVSGAVLREFLGERGAQVEEPGVGGPPLFLPSLTSWRLQARLRWRTGFSFIFSFVFHVRSSF